MESLIEKLNRTETRIAQCEKHGEFSSRLFMGRIWSKCPRCAEEADQEAKLAQEQAERERRTRAWQQRIGHAGIPERFQNRTLDSYRADTDGQRTAKEFARQYANGFDEVLETGRSALFVGLPGTGKTHLAVGIGLEVMRSGHSALFTTVIRAIRSIKDTWGQHSQQTEAEVIRGLTYPDLLILDEIGVQFGSDTEKLLLFDVLNERYENRRPTVMLSNLAPDAVKAYLGERVFDRLREDGGQMIVFNWPSARGKINAASALTVPEGFDGRSVTKNPLFDGCL